MKNNILKSLLVIGTVFVMTGCGESSSPVDVVSMDLGDPLDVTAEEIVTSDVPSTDTIDLQDPIDVDGSVEEIVTVLPTEVQDAIDTPKSTLTPELKDSITFMYNEEGLAYDVYMNIYNFQIKNNLSTVNQFKQIASGDQNGSEETHIEAVNQLAIKYDLNMTQYPDTDVPYSIEGISSGVYTVEHIQELYGILYEKGIESKQDALEVGCMVEVVDILDLEGYIEKAESSNAPDVVAVFNFLLNGSYKHYQQFDKALRDMEVENGCCIVPAALGYDSFCNDEYLSK